MPKCLTVYSCFNYGQVRSLFPHKDNTIILKRLWSLVIESSKGTRILRDRGGQLLDCREQREMEGGRNGEEESIKLVGPFQSWHVVFVNPKSLVSSEFRAQRLLGSWHHIWAQDVRFDCRKVAESISLLLAVFEDQAGDRVKRFDA